MPQQGFVRAQSDGEALWFLGNLFTIKASAKETGGWTVIEALAPPNDAPPPHVHHDEDEAWYVLEGDVTFSCGGETLPAKAGSFVFAPRGVPHWFSVGPNGVRMLVFATPKGQFEQFVREMSEPAQSRTLPPPGPPDIEKLQSLAAKLGIELLGPPPG